MVSGRTKKVVVIKDIQSNLIEEAILILKNENDTGNDKSSKPEHNKKQAISNDFLIKEAEMIIENYIKENKLQAVRRREQKDGRFIYKKKLPVNLIINSALAGSVILLAFLIMKLF